jgi:hypothetical protein
MPWVGSVNVTGDGITLPRTGTDLDVDSVSITLDTPISEVVRGGSVILTVIVVVPYLVTPLVVSGHVSLNVSVMTGKLIVVLDESGHGGRMRVQGG